jgi:hypothetical protein
MGAIADEATRQTREKLALALYERSIDGLDKEVVQVIESGDTPIWLARAMDHGLNCDPVDACNYFEKAAEMFKRRVERIFKEAGVS